MDFNIDFTLPETSFFNTMGMEIIYLPPPNCHQCCVLLSHRPLINRSDELTC